MKPELKRFALPTRIHAPASFRSVYLPGIRQNPHLLWSFLGAGAALLAWNALTLVAARRKGRRLIVEVVLRKQHYLQACAHLSILLYWGWYWRVVYDSALLIAGQLVFAYAFDALLTWSRRDTYTLGFGPFPIIFSTNLFLWFKPDWFYFQFLMVAVGFAAKELIRWNKEGRQTHIFNPSSFTLALFSLGLLLTGTTGITWGQEISTTQYNPPHIFLLIFLVTLPAQFLFGTAAMTLSAVATTYTFGVVYPGGNGQPLLLPGAHSHRRLPGHAPAVHRPVHVAAHRTGAHYLRRALRLERRRADHDLHVGESARVLRQAAARADSQFDDSRD